MIDHWHKGPMELSNLETGSRDILREWAEVLQLPEKPYNPNAEELLFTYLFYLDCEVYYESTYPHSEYDTSCGIIEELAENGLLQVNGFFVLTYERVYLGGEPSVPAEDGA